VGVGGGAVGDMGVAGEGCGAVGVGVAGGGVVTLVEVSGTRANGSLAPAARGAPDDGAAPAGRVGVGVRSGVGVAVAVAVGVGVGIGVGVGVSTTATGLSSSSAIKRAAARPASRDPVSASTTMTALRTGPAGPGGSSRRKPPGAARDSAGDESSVVGSTTTGGVPSVIVRCHFSGCARPTTSMTSPAGPSIQARPSRGSSTQRPWREPGRFSSALSSLAFASRK